MPKFSVNRRLALSGMAAAAAGVSAYPILSRAWSTTMQYEFTGPAADRKLGLAPPTECTPGTLSQTEGPYYTPSTPRRSSLLEPGSSGETLILEGLILTRDCKPVAGAIIDIWHCDERGRYDNAGYSYRGHQFTDASGAFRFTTIRPTRYSGRTPHIHVKVKGKSTRMLTTQLYFPDLEELNERDSIFREGLLIDLRRNGKIWHGRFDFVLAAA
ncbi:MAG: hypothetical protein OXI87_22450 [Albidovulum sp.]|nr:hypothetical protein [Albidovulum sp.]MDE0307617.1 hypothetical protein [Albidovulum sp.]MDE0533085.1 hypothetical protein [Albidovulum sp.]